MPEAPPIVFDWDGEAMAPATKHMARLCDHHFVVGERYMLAEHHERSMNSHRHFFALIHEGWANLPERYADAPWGQTSEHLRKYALIKTGYCDTATLVCSSKAEAQRTAAFMRPVDPFSIVAANEATVTRYTAQSQSNKAMGGRVFQQSKNDVLDFIETLLAVDHGKLRADAA